MEEIIQKLNQIENRLEAIENKLTRPKKKNKTQNKVKRFELIFNEEFISKIQEELNTKEFISLNNINKYIDSQFKNIPLSTLMFNFKEYNKLTNKFTVSNINPKTGLRFRNNAYHIYDKNLLVEINEPNGEF